MASERLSGSHEKYSGVKVMQIIGEIRLCDAKSKGVKNSSVSDGDLLRELIYL